MTRGRFDKLCQYFHVNVQTGCDCQDPDRNKLQLIRSIIDVVSHTCFDSYVARKENSIDEAVIKFREILAFRQYLPAKPTKFGIKVWVHADSTNGYACEFQVYVGRPPGVKTEVGLGKYVVLELTGKLIRKQSRIYFDNYFNSVGHQEKLLERQLYGCGTVKSNVIGIPEMMRVTKRELGDPPPLKVRP